MDLPLFVGGLRLVNIDYLIRVSYFSNYFQHKRNDVIQFWLAFNTLYIACIPTPTHRDDAEVGGVGPEDIGVLEEGHHPTDAAGQAEQPAVVRLAEPTKGRSMIECTNTIDISWVAAMNLLWWQDTYQELASRAGTTPLGTVALSRDNYPWDNCRGFTSGYYSPRQQPRWFWGYMDPPPPLPWFHT